MAKFCYLKQHLSTESFSCRLLQRDGKGWTCIGKVHTDPNYFLYIVTRGWGGGLPSFSVAGLLKAEVFTVNLAETTYPRALSLKVFFIALPIYLRIMY